MTDLRKAAEQALEALEEVKSWKSATRWDGCFDEEIQALRQALAKPQTRVGEMEWQWGYERGWDAAMNQKREWVGLTDEDIDDLWKKEYFNVHYQLPKAVEARLKEKNT